MSLARGFAAHAEMIAEEVRAGLGLTPFQRLDPLRLAEDLEIPVVALSALAVVAGDDQRAQGGISLLTGQQNSALSAVTVFRGSKRVIVHNDSHTAGRQASNLSHELAHGLLLHQPRPALDQTGCRDWDAAIEEEASYLGGALLIPGKAARGAITLHRSITQVAAQYGTSDEMARWRLNLCSRRGKRKVA